MVDFGLFQTANETMRKMLELAQSVALTPAPILISGASGSGKTLLAQFIMEKSRHMGPIFRWAPMQRPDLSSLKDGVVILEDLSGWDLSEQGILNDFMDLCRMEKRRVRFIAQTSADLRDLTQDGSFRKDLFFRLSVINLQIPSLNSRPEDILVLADFFVQVHSHIKNQGLKALSEEAKATLLQSSWPGNVTELENVIERAVHLSQESVIAASAIQFLDSVPAIASSVAGVTTLSEMEKKLILQTLQITKQNKTKAAQLLGISIRTLRNKLNEYRQEGAL
jgi:two-component system response regulator FlrC